MSIDRVVATLDAEIARLQKVRGILTGGAFGKGRRKRRKHRMSAESRARIVKAQKARWAKWRAKKG